MGQYFIVVNQSKKQFIDIDELGESCKLGYVGQGLHALSLGRLLASVGKNYGDGFYNIYGHPDSDEIYLGAWAGDEIVIAGDYGLPDAHGIQTGSDEDPSLNLYDKAITEYEDITDKVIRWLANDESTADMLVQQAKCDGELLQKLSDLVFIHKHRQMQASLERILGPDWTKQLRK